MGLKEDRWSLETDSVIWKSDRKVFEKVILKERRSFTEVVSYQQMIYYQGYHCI